MAEVRIRVGAAMDSDVSSVFSPVEAAAAKARKKVESELNAGAKAGAAGLQKGAKEAAGAFDGTAKSVEELNKRLAQTRKEAADASAALAKVRAERKLLESRQASNRDLADRIGAGYARTQMATAVVQAVTSMPAVSLGKRIGADIAKGMGVDFGLSSFVGKSMESAKLASKLSISAYKPWEKGSGTSAGTQVDSNVLNREAGGLAKQFGFDRKEVLEAMQNYVDLTGELDTIRGIMPQIAAYSNATGTALNDAAQDAAALGIELSKTYGSDNAGRMKAVFDIMRAQAAMGKEGAVEVKNLVANGQISKLLSTSSRFSGGSEGAAGVIVTLNALAQLNKKFGGAASVQQVTTQLNTMANSLITNEAKWGSAGKGKVKGAGLDIWADKKHTQLKSPDQLMQELIVKTGGDLSRIHQIVPESKSFGMISGLASIYNTAEARQKGSGAAALEAEIAALKKATMSEADILEQNAKRMQDADKKAAAFNENLQTIADSMVAKVLPAFEKLAPQVLSLADSLGKTIGWAAENPGSAMAAGVGVSVSKAIAEQLAIASAKRLVDVGGKAFDISRLLVNAGGDKLGKLGSAGAIAAMSVAAITVGKMTIDKMVDNSVKKEQANVRQGVAAQSEAAMLIAKANRGEALSSKETERAKELVDTLGANRDEQRDKLSLGVMDRFLGWFASDVQVVGPGKGAGRKQSLNEGREALAQDIASRDQSANLMKGLQGVLAKMQVNVTVKVDKDGTGTASPNVDTK